MRDKLISANKLIEELYEREAAHSIQQEEYYDRTLHERETRIVEYGKYDPVDVVRQSPTVNAIPVEWIERKIKESLYDRYASWEDIAAQVDTNTMMKSWAILVERWKKER